VSPIALSHPISLPIASAISVPLHVVAAWPVALCAARVAAADRAEYRPNPFDSNDRTRDGSVTVQLRRPRRQLRTCGTGIHAGKASYLSSGGKATPPSRANTGQFLLIGRDRALQMNNTAFPGTDPAASATGAKLTRAVHAAIGGGSGFRKPTVNLCDQQNNGFKMWSNDLPRPAGGAEDFRFMMASEGRIRTTAGCRKRSRLTKFTVLATIRNYRHRPIVHLRTVTPLYLQLWKNDTIKPRCMLQSLFTSATTRYEIAVSFDMCHPRAPTLTLVLPQIPAQAVPRRTGYST